MYQRCKSSRPTTSRVSSLNVQAAPPTNWMASGDTIEDCLRTSGRTVSSEWTPLEYFLEPAVDVAAMQARIFRERLLRHLLVDAMRRQAQNSEPAAAAAPKQPEPSLFKRLRTMFKRNNRVGVLPSEEKIDEPPRASPNGEEKRPKKSLWKRLQSFCQWKK
ncbi:hypothetical protein DPEC_G00237640 [Dallia pectoralis]|uniref:Uncharacterized protein n=1 Tax=Dallia pectoralis TaxID=75939 RepID=A0ACC2FYM3_DALPE|nr:hypothetical protein DPEC_G00237640 [Dallia pectoralis]